MALNIRPQVREALKPKLIDYLKGVEVVSGSILSSGRAITHLLDAESVLGLALALFKIEGSVPSSNVRQTIQFGHIDGSDVQRVSQKELSHAESGTIQSIMADTGRSEGMDLLMGGTGKLDAMSKLFREPQQHAPLLRACRWLYDSHVGEDKLLNFVQAMVVLEILLGDRSTSDEVGLGTLLANRCAYRKACE